MITVPDIERRKFGEKVKGIGRSFSLDKHRRRKKGDQHWNVYRFP